MSSNNEAHGDEDDIWYTDDELYDLYCQEADLRNDQEWLENVTLGDDTMTNLKVLEEILERLIDLDHSAKDRHVKCAIADNMVKYARRLEEEKEKNAARVVEHQIADLTERLV